MTGSNVSRRDLVFCLAIAIATIAIYWQSASAPFVAYDDPVYVTENSHVQSGLSLTNIRWAATAEVAGNWHPLTLFSHMLDCQLFGLDAGRHHLVNLAFHITNTLLLFWLLRYMTGAFWPCAFTVALFAWHPLHVQSVAWIAERKDVLSGFFGLLALLAYSKYAGSEKSVPGQRRVFYFLSLLSFALGLLCKPMLVTLPFLMLLLDFWPLQRSFKSFPRLILEKVPFFILTGISCIVTYRVQATEGATHALHIAMTDRFANALLAYCQYLGKFIWPDRLAVLYPYAHSFGAMAVIGAVTLLMVVTIFALYSRNQRPYILMGWLWFLGSLVPVIGVIQVGKQSMADRYAYLPSIGIFVTLAWLVADLDLRFPKWKPVLNLACAIALAGCAVQSWRQLAYWQSSELLFRHAIEVTGDNEVMEYNLGVVLSHDGKYDEALEHERRALTLDPSDAAVYNAVGSDLASLGRPAEALEYYVQAESLKAGDFATRFNHGQSLEKLGRNAEALDQYSAAVRALPGNAAGHLALGSLLLNLGRAGEAKPELAQAAQLQPADESAHAELGSALNTLGQTAEAIEQYQLAVKLNPSDYIALNNLAWIRATSSRSEFRSGTEAVTLAQRACELTQSKQPELIGTLAAAYAETGNFPEAIATTHKAINLALATGQKDLAATNQALLILYQSGRPFREAK